MKNKEHTEILDSLTVKQRRVIANIIRGADIEGSYGWNGEYSVWEESASDTLENLARYFETYDPTSVLD